MALKIRMRQQGRTRRPFYRVVVTDSRNPRDGAYVEALRWYNPFAEGDKNLSLNPERIVHWLNLGAMMTDKIEALVARAAPSIIVSETEKELARKAKAREKRKARKQAKV